MQPSIQLADHPDVDKTGLKALTPSRRPFELDPTSGSFLLKNCSAEKVSQRGALDDTLYSRCPA